LEATKHFCETRDHRHKVIERRHHHVTAKANRNFELLENTISSHGQ
jgi:hypothetical protein